MQVICRNVHCEILSSMEPISLSGTTSHDAQVPHLTMLVYVHMSLCNASLSLICWKKSYRHEDSRNRAALVAGRGPPRCSIIETAKRPSADDTTANQTTTSHCWCGRSGLESHDCKANDDEGSPRPPAHIRTLVMH